MITRTGIALILGLGVLCVTCLGALCDDSARIIKVSARRFEYSPQEITLRKGVPVVFQLTTEDRSHGFNVLSMNIRTVIVKGKVTELKVTPQKVGKFEFFCDVFCGSGHEGMNGNITVTE